MFFVPKTLVVSVVVLAAMAIDVYKDGEGTEYKVLFDSDLLCGARRIWT